MGTPSLHRYLVKVMMELVLLANIMTVLMMLVNMMMVIMLVTIHDDITILSGVHLLFVVHL